MRTITIEVNDDTAERFLKMSIEEKQSISNLINELIKDTRTFDQVMDDMSMYAKKKGLTQEKLNDILNEDCG